MPKASQRPLCALRPQQQRGVAREVGSSQSMAGLRVRLAPFFRHRPHRSTPCSGCRGQICSATLTARAQGHSLLVLSGKLGTEEMGLSVRERAHRPAAPRGRGDILSVAGPPVPPTAAGSSPWGPPRASCQCSLSSMSQLTLNRFWKATQEIRESTGTKHTK